METIDGRGLRGGDGRDTEVCGDPMFLFSMRVARDILRRIKKIKL